MPISPPSDILERVDDAIVAELDTYAGITAITGALNGNVVPWGEPAANAEIFLRYAPIYGTLTGIAPGEFWRVMVQVSAFANDTEQGSGKMIANALLEHVQLAATAKRFAELSTPLDAHVNAIGRRGARRDPETGLWQADLTLTLTAKK